MVRSTKEITWDRNRKQKRFDGKLPVIAGVTLALVFTALLLGVVGLARSGGGSGNITQRVSEYVFLEVLTRFEESRSFYKVTPTDELRLLEQDGVLSGFVNAHSKSVMAGDLYLFIVNAIKKCDKNGGNLDSIASNTSAAAVPAAAIASCGFDEKEKKLISFMLGKSKDYFAEVQSLWYHCIECGRSGPYASCSQCGGGIAKGFEVRMDEQRKKFQASNKS